ncbi:MAG TPA: hypothetical protein VMT62_03725 [Syntrophorhabdaceae bacterium]|nr:hypothetical protein [Syntrophorhabdaceae bacterium]
MQLRKKKDRKYRKFEPEEAGFKIPGYTYGSFGDMWLLTGKGWASIRHVNQYYLVNTRNAMSENSHEAHVVYGAIMAEIDRRVRNDEWQGVTPALGVAA